MSAVTAPRAPAMNLHPLAPVLRVATEHRFAVGSFSPRYLGMIRPILRAAESVRSPLIVQVSQREMERYGTTPEMFATAFLDALGSEGITVPVVLHLDHTFDFEILKRAIAAGFTSVMMDGSAKPFDHNVEVSKKAAEIAHAAGVSVEAELGRIGTTDFVETESDEEFYTDPQEARIFVERTGVDALAVSVGTAHGAYTVRQPTIDYDRLQAIRALTGVHLVLHGGSGVPAEMIQKAVQQPGGGISKVNIATDLEEALLNALGLKDRMTNEAFDRLDPASKAKAERAVEQTVIAKINTFLCSAEKARLFEIL